MGIFPYLKKCCKESDKIMKICATLYSVIGMNKKRICVKRNNMLLNKGAFLKKCKIQIDGCNNKILFGRGIVLKNCTFLIHGNNNKIHLSENGGAIDAEFYIEEDNNAIFVGKHTGFCGKIHIACTEGTEVRIGEECLFSSDVFIRTGDSHSILDEYGIRINNASDILIGDRVWVGQDVKILKGSCLLEDSVIATGTILTKKFQNSNIIVGGNPAKIIKENISWKHERI